MVNVDEEVNQLLVEIARLGTKGKDGKISVPFGILIRDERCEQIFEAIMGTLKAAKKRKLINYEAEILLMGVHDKIDIVIL